jgi:hypothetical protein
MPPNYHPCTDRSDRKSLSDLFHHPMEERTKHQEGNNKKICETIILKIFDANKNKGICKALET